MDESKKPKWGKADDIKYSEAKEQLTEDIKRTLAYRVSFRKISGSALACLFLSQLWYWTPIKKRHADGWVYKKIEDWETETGLTYDEQVSARKHLSKRGLIEERIGFKNEKHYRINLKRLVALATGAEVYQEKFSEGQKKSLENLKKGKQKKVAQIKENSELSETEISDNSENQTLEMSEIEISEVSENKASDISENYTKEYNKEYDKDYLQENTTNIRNTAPPQNAAVNVGLKFDDVECKESKKANVIEDTVSIATQIGRNTAGYSIQEADLAVAAFQSVGASVFDVTFKSDITGKLRLFEENILLADRLREFLERNETQKESFIVRPRGGVLIQIDDVNALTLRWLIPYCFLAKETSKNNYQVWLALPRDTSETDLNSIKRRLFNRLKDSSGNGGAHGATRFPASINHKPDRNRFRVRLIHVFFARYTSAEELDNAGLLALEIKNAELENAELENANQGITKGFRGKFPDYEKCLEDKGGDRSEADAQFVWICNARRYSKQEAKRALADCSDRFSKEIKKGRGDRYFDRLVKLVYDKNQ